jgi:hypothetical protein
VGHFALQQQSCKDGGSGDNRILLAVVVVVVGAGGGDQYNSSTCSSGIGGATFFTGLLSSLRSRAEQTAVTELRPECRQMTTSSFFSFPFLFFVSVSIQAS